MRGPRGGRAAAAARLPAEAAARQEPEQRPLAAGVSLARQEPKFGGERAKDQDVNPPPPAAGAGQGPRGQAAAAPAHHYLDSRRQGCSSPRPGASASVGGGARNGCQSPGGSPGSSAAPGVGPGPAGCETLADVGQGSALRENAGARGKVPPPGFLI